VKTETIVDLIKQKSSSFPNSGLFNDFDNTFCVIYGGLSGSYGIISFCFLALMLAYLVFDNISEKFCLERLNGFLNSGLFLLVFFTFWNKPVNILATHIEIFNPYYGSNKPADVTTIGRKGKVQLNYVGMILGFSGIKICNPLGKYNQYILGTAIAIDEP
jgi:hypothetical protein